MERILSQILKEVKRYSDIINFDLQLFIIHSTLCTNLIVQLVTSLTL